MNNTDPTNNLLFFQPFYSYSHLFLLLLLRDYVERGERKKKVIPFGFLLAFETPSNTLNERTPHTQNFVDITH